MGVTERIVIGALAWGAFAFGAVYPWAYWPLAAVCAAVGARAIVVDRLWQDHRAVKLGVALGAVAAAIAIQLVALPYTTLQWLSPAFDRFFRESTVAYHPASLHPLSIGPASTLVALLLFLAFSVFFVGLLGALRKIPLEWLVNHLMGLGLALATVGVIQKAFPMDDAYPVVYGFWEPRHGGNPFGPFINRNHFAGWMVMALPVVGGYACAVLAQTFQGRRQGLAAALRWATTVDASRFLLVVSCALMMGMALVLTGSRSGIASFAIAVLVFAALAARGFRDRRARLRVAALALAFLGAAVIWAGTDATVGRFLSARTDSSGRIAAWQDTLRIVADFPLAGTGMGTYAQAMLVYQTASRPKMYAQAHNDYLQVLAEGGVLVAIPAAAVALAILVTLRRRLRAAADDRLTWWVRVGAVAGLAGIAAQSLVEFSLQMPGNTTLAALLLALALHRPRPVESPRGASRPRRSHARLDADRV